MRKKVASHLRSQAGCGLAFVWRLLEELMLGSWRSRRPSVERLGLLARCLAFLGRGIARTEICVRPHSRELTRRTKWDSKSFETRVPGQAASSGVGLCGACLCKSMGTGPQQLRKPEPVVGRFLVLSLGSGHSVLYVGHVLARACLRPPACNPHQALRAGSPQRPGAHSMLQAAMLRVAAPRPCPEPGLSADERRPHRPWPFLCRAKGYSSMASCRTLTRAF